MGRRTTLGVYLKAISSSGSLLFLLLLHFYGGEIISGASAASPPVSSLTEKKCDKVVVVESPEILSYLGNVTFHVPTAFRGRWTTVIKFTSPFTFIGGWGVTVQSFGRKAYAIFDRNDEENLKKGEMVIFQFRVLYARNVKVPKVLSIKWQDKFICGPKFKESYHQLFIPDRPAEEDGTDDESSESEDTPGQVQQHIATNSLRL